MILRMDKNITNLFIQQLYKETSWLENERLNLELDNNTAFCDEAIMLEEAFDALPKVLFNPSDRVLENILRHSRETTPEAV
jgi:hypothetical protein